MAKKPIKIKIDVTKISKDHLYKGKKGTYLTCAVWENRDGEDEYGNTHYITQEISREARDDGVKAPIIGNCKMDMPEHREGQRRGFRNARNATKYGGSGMPDEPDDGSDIPF